MDHSASISEGLSRLAREMEEELRERILPYWIQKTLDPYTDGFVARIAGGRVFDKANRGVVLISRILWTFSAAQRRYDHPAYIELADRAYLYIVNRFWDHAHGGLYWEVDPSGHPADSRKLVYGQAFGLYGLSEYARATGSRQAAELVEHLFNLITERCLDNRHGGYFEAFSRSWQLLGGVGLSRKPIDASKGMNTHLHLLEAFTNVLRLSRDAAVESRVEDLLLLFLDKIIDSERHQVVAFFASDWTATDQTISYGHDIETATLMVEAAELLGDDRLIDVVRGNALSMVDRVLAEGVDADGGLFNELDEVGRLDTDKHWWSQAEAIVGFVGAFELTHRLEYLDAAMDTWQFVKRHIIDSERGEWFFRVSREGVPYADEDKVGPWKCPYHNARACLEIGRRAASHDVHLANRALMPEGNS